MEEATLRPDSKGRLNLGDLAQGVSSYRVTKGENGSLTLKPYFEVSFEEKWIFDNEETLEKIKHQLQQEGDIVAD